jgi:hypothetical protein
VFLWGLFVAFAVGCEGKSPELCSGGEDEDRDGQIDCADSDCWVPGGPCAENCSTVFDEDGDGADGCEDSDCWLVENDCPEDCDGGEDEDADGAVDCEDSDCWVAEERCPEICDSGADEDADGAVDCEDSECWLAENDCPEICGGGDDEDVDGLVDCDDEDCFAEVFCVPLYDPDVRPIFMTHCLGPASDCHSEATRLGGLSVESYDDFLLPANYCPGLTKGECSLFRILEPTMPQNCLGCLSDAEESLVQRWVDGGLPP